MGHDIGGIVREVIAQTLRLSPDQVTDERLLESELNVDSMAMIEINVGVEERLAMAMPDMSVDDARRIRTVADYIALVAAQVPAAAATPAVTPAATTKAKAGEGRA